VSTVSALAPTQTPTQTQAPAPMPVYEWKTLPWRAIEQAVFKLQKRIYQASQRDDKKTVHNLQHLMVRSWAARCLAVRRVTQDNQGKKTAGIDGVKSLTPQQRMELVQSLDLRGKPQPVRRVWILKPGAKDKTERRPLGIPVIHDRAAQALVKLALEPEWEAKFEPNSYGFRPGRSAHDAIAAIFDSIKYMQKYVLDADIAKCFERINQSALLEKLDTTPMLRRVIKGWLKAGVMDGDELFPTEEGTQQGGVISPLLANVALHGLETAVREAFPANHMVHGPGHRGQEAQRIQNWKPQVIRYADDLVILHRDQAVIEQSKEVVQAWLKNMGLELKPSKTRITHTLQAVEGEEGEEGEAGFDFLGFNVRHYHVGKTHIVKTGGRTRGQTNEWVDFKTIIKPSKTALHRHYAALSKVITELKAASQDTVIAILNPKIRGWSGYYRTVVASRAFSKLDHLVWNKLMRWAKYRHPRKGSRWVVRKYFNIEGLKRPGEMRWLFVSDNGPALIKHASTAIRRHVKVEGGLSPYNGDWVYWASRLGRYPGLTKRVAILLKRQAGRCAWCKLYFRGGEELREVDHITPQSRGGRETYANWQLLHRHCHDMKTAGDRSTVGGIQDKDRIAEEPDEWETLMSGFEGEVLRATAEP
jgi:RNA-directed DNA polymerase